MISRREFLVTLSGASTLLLGCLPAPEESKSTNAKAPHKTFWRNRLIYVSSPETDKFEDYALLSQLR